jgi:hypothetical protein
MQTVTFDETGKELEVKRTCQHRACYRRIMLATQPEVVSPDGTAHKGSKYGMTACGIDATGDHWWHRL